jgi:biopolymer transport protein ExbD
MGADRQPGAITGINVTPLVDITLVLLIIFMVTAKLIVRREALNVELPPAAAGAPEEPEVFSVVLTAQGDVQIDGARPVSDASLRAQAAAARARRPDLRAVIKADGSVPHRRVIRVLDLLQQAGVSRIGFGVEPQRD